MKLSHTTRWVICILTLVVVVAGVATAQETTNKRFSVVGGVGMSGARGDYASEYDASIDFSFFPGLRFRLDGAIAAAPESYLMFDFVFLKTGFNGYVAATDTTFYNGYEYLNVNAMFGGQTNALYYGGGLYLAPGLDAYSYREYTDEWVDLDSNADFGLVGEIGSDVTRLLSVGIQARWGLKSIGSSVDIKNWGILATVAFHFHRF